MVNAFICTLYQTCPSGIVLFCVLREKAPRIADAASLNLSSATYTPTTQMSAACFNGCYQRLRALKRYFVTSVAVNGNPARMQGSGH